MTKKIIIATFLLWAGFGQIVNAISCAPLSAEFAQQGFDKNPIVFVGTVVDVDRSTQGNTLTGYYAGTALYNVERVYKGEVTERFLMEASGWGDPFVGHTYLMFVDSADDPGFDRPEFCLNATTDYLEFEIEDVFGEGYAPLSSDNEYQIPILKNESRVGRLSVAGLMVVATAVGGYFARRNHSSKSSKEKKFDVE